MAGQSWGTPLKGQFCSHADRKASGVCVSDDDFGDEATLAKRSRLVYALAESFGERKFSFQAFPLKRMPRAILLDTVL